MNKLDLYELLGIDPSASHKEIHEAYLQTKTAYHLHNPAHYSLIESAEREEILKKIEEAYFILSHRDHQKNHGTEMNPPCQADQQENFQEKKNKNETLISIDRVPPMEFLSESENLLIPPTTDIPLKETKKILSPIHSDLVYEISVETQWKGTFIRKVRQAHKISIEELCELTRISRTYLLAIEEEAFAKLPALVYTRGFVSQIAKILKLPYDRVANAYFRRMQNALQSKK